MLQCYINRISWLLLPPLHWETETAPTKIWLGALKCESYFLLDADLPPIILPWHLYSKICNQWSACYVATGVKQWLTHTNKNRLRLFSMNECTTSKQTHHCCIQPLTRLSSSFTVDVHKCLMQHRNRVYVSSVQSESDCGGFCCSVACNPSNNSATCSTGTGFPSSDIFVGWITPALQQRKHTIWRLYQSWLKSWGVNRHTVWTTRPYICSCSTRCVPES